jgi:hypothetical protein
VTRDLSKPVPCRRCQKPVLPARTERGKWIALDPKPDPKGNQAAWQDSDGTWKTRQLSPGSDPPWNWERVHMPHVATCKPEAVVPLKPALPPNVTPVPHLRGADRRQQRG